MFVRKAQCISQHAGWQRIIKGHLKNILLKAAERVSKFDLDGVNSAYTEKDKTIQL